MRKILLILLFPMLISCMSKANLARVYNEAVSLMRGEQFQEAIALLENKVPKLQRNFNYYYAVGLCCLRMDSAANRRIANDFFMKSYTFKKNNYNNLYLLGDTFASMNNLNDAEVYFSKAVLIWNANQNETERFAQEPFGWLAQVFYKQGKYQEAMEMINKSLEIKPDFQISVLLKGQIYAKLGDLSLFNTWYDSAHKINPDNVLLNVEYGKTLIEIAEYDKAHDFFLNMEKAVNTDPTARYLSCLELLYLEILNKNYDKAYEYLQTANEVYAGNNTLLKYKAFYFWKTGQNMRANNAFRLYKYYAENLSEVSSTTSTDLTDFFDYFKDDIYFKLLL